MNLRSSLIPRSNKTSGGKGFADDPSSLGIKYRAEVNKIKTHEMRFFSPPLTPRIEASQTGVFY
jgi:hypothetical protein